MNINEKIYEYFINDEEALLDLIEYFRPLVYTLMKQKMYNTYDDLWARNEMLSYMDLLLIECLHTYRLDSKASFKTYFMRCAQLRMYSVSARMQKHYFNADVLSLDVFVQEDIPVYRVNKIEDPRFEPHSLMLADCIKNEAIQTFEGWKQEAFSLKLKGFNAKEIGQILHRNEKTVRKALNLIKLKKQD